MLRVAHEGGGVRARSLVWRRNGSAEKGHVREMNTTERLSTLKVQHERLELELENLHRRAHLTPTEEMRARVIKKQKLQTKDHIRLLISQARKVR
jgi:hypothetical protein